MNFILNNCFVNMIYHYLNLKIFAFKFEFICSFFFSKKKKKKKKIEIFFFQKNDLFLLFEFIRNKLISIAFHCWLLFLCVVEASQTSIANNVADEANSADDNSSLPKTPQESQEWVCFDFHLLRRLTHIHPILLSFNIIVFFHFHYFILLR